MSEPQTTAPRPPVQREPEHAPEARPVPKGIMEAEQPMGALPKQKRRTAEFTIPASVRSRPNDPSKVTLRELTVEEVEAARRIADGDRTKSVIEQAKLSIYMVDGKVVEHGYDEGTFFYNNWSQKVRELIVLGYDRHTSSNQEEVRDFLSSMVSS